MSKGDASGARFGQRGRLGRRFAALVRVGLGRVAPRIVRVTLARVRPVAVRAGGLMGATAASLPVAWRAASLPAATVRHRRNAGSAAVRKGIALLRAWGGVTPGMRRGAREAAKAGGRAVAGSPGRQAVRRPGDVHARLAGGGRAMVPLHAGLTRRALRFMAGSALSRQPLAPSEAMGRRGARFSPVGEAGVDVARRQGLSADGVMAVMPRDRGAAAPPGTVGRPEMVGTTVEPAGPADMARWLGALFNDEARRPPSGVTGFDGRLSPIFPGRKPGF